MSPLKVLLISPLPPPAGGIASWSIGVIRELDKRSDVLLTHLDTAVRWRSTNDRRLIARIVGGTLQALIDTGRVCRAIVTSRPDVMHLCTSASLAAAKDLLIVGIGRILGIKSVIHYRFGRLPELVAGGGWEWQLIRRSMKLADAVVLLDKASVEAVQGATGNTRIVRLPNPIDPSLLSLNVPTPEADSADDTFRIVFAGHVIRTKGVSELVQACAGLALTGMRLQLELVGQVEEDYRQELAAMARQYADGGWLTFRGQLTRDESVAAIRRSDLFALPSYTEGFPNVILEAMAMGRPIVATRVGAIPEMLGDKTPDACGIVVAPADVDELAAAIREYHDNRARAINDGQAGRHRVLSQYTMERAVDNYTGLWRSLPVQGGSHAAD